jgi:hypothetical protein
MNRSKVADVLIRLATALAIIGAVCLVLALVSGCEPRTGGTDPCGREGCVVPPQRPVADAKAVPDCEETEGFGPCTYVDDAPDGRTHWYYVDEGGMYPDLGTRDLGLWAQPDAPPVYVPLCRDVDAGNGPCLDRDGTTWRYVRQGAAWPSGTAVSLCPGEDGGPSLPCAWIPSVQGNYTGDSGAFVYGVAS